MWTKLLKNLKEIESDESVNSEPYLARGPFDLCRGRDNFTIFFFLQISSPVQLPTAKRRRSGTQGGWHCLRDGKVWRWLVCRNVSEVWNLWHFPRQLRGKSMIAIDNKHIKQPHNYKKKLYIHTQLTLLIIKLIDNLQNTVDLRNARTVLSVQLSIDWRRRSRDLKPNNEVLEGTWTPTIFDYAITYINT